MTCTCIEKIAAAIRADKAKYPHAEGHGALGRIADALSPAPAEPGKPAPTTGTANTRPYAAVVADGKPAPASTTAAKPLSVRAQAEHLIRYCPFFHGISDTRDEIAAALTAAHAEGDAAGYARGCPKPRKWPEQKPREGEPYLWWDEPCKSWRGCDFTERYMDDTPMWWLPQPAAPDAKEAGR